MKVHLSPRLQRIADYVLPGGTVIDVGTDHAYIPIYLLQNGISTHAYASDLRAGPLENARRDAINGGVDEHLTLWHCDGLADCPSEAVDTVIIAGMGGETIQGILAAAPWARGKRCILQPQTKYRELRRFLSDAGQRISDAALAYDTGRIYLVWLVEQGRMDPDCALDPVLVEKRDKLLTPYTEELIKRARKQINGLERSKVPDSAQLALLRRDLEELTRIHEEAASWQR
jgi:tRNA (adenine22-N1)-methyltransferase